MSPTLHIRLLGDFSMLYGDELLAGITTPRLQSLFAYLILHRDAPQPRQHLAFLFWPDTSEAQARTNLRQLLHQLRHALPDADRYLHVDASSLCWRADAACDLDVAAFEHALAAADAAAHEDAQCAALERAAALYRADLLPSCYDDWIVGARERLRQHHRHARTRLIGLLEARRDYGAAIVHAQRLIQDDPIDEGTYRDLMRLLALNNDRAGALRVYHTCVTSLQRELGIEPSPPTRAAYERLLRLDASDAVVPKRPPMRDAGASLDWPRARVGATARCLAPC